MDLNQFMLALRARRKAFMLVFVTTVVTAIAIALILPKRYVATTTILVDMPTAQSLGTGGVTVSPRERSAYVQTQIDMLQSGRVAAQVARNLKLAQEPGMREQFESESGGVGDINDWIAARLLERLKADVSGSNVITVTFASPDSRRAAEVANGVAKAYVDTTLALRTEPTRNAATWFKEQLKALRAQVNQAQARLTAYQKEKGIMSVVESTDVEAARLSELSTQLLTARNATYEAQTRYRQAQEVLASGMPDAHPDLMSNVAVAAVRADLARAEGLLQASSADLGPNHPVFQRQESEVRALRAKLSTEMKKAVAALGSAATQAQRREDELKNALAQQRNRVLAQKDYRVELATLTRDVETQQRAYDAALTRMVSNQVDSQAREANVAVLTPAVEPLVPAFPRIGLISGLALVVGALLAASVVFLLETLDRRVRSRADLEARLAVPTLGRLSRWQPAGGRLLPAPARANRALPHPW